jgi:outer membrane protein OmpA-like peptidoglycan-associated protein
MAFPRAVGSAQAATLPTRPQEASALRPAVPVAPPVAPAPSVTAPQAVAPVAPAPPAVVAALPAQRVQAGSLGRVDFPAESAEVPASARAMLDRAAVELQRDPDARLRLTAVSSAADSSVARRLSLSRALAVRSYLIERGVRATRMDLQALAGRPGESVEPGDRVDVVVVAR